MKYAHIDLNTNELLGWYSTDVHDVIPEPNVEVTDEQWQTALDNEHDTVNSDGTTEKSSVSTIKDQEANIRAERNHILVSSVDPVVSNPLRWVELTEPEQASIVSYRTALLDITEQATFPTSVTWPVKPEVLS